jgi:protein-disulfide isomerase
MKNPWKIFALALGGLLIISLVWQYFTLRDFDNEFKYLQGKSAAVLNLAKEQGVVFGQEFAEEYGAEALEPLPDPEPIDVSADDDFYSGQADAKLSLIVFNDYQCPFSANVHDSIKQVRSEFSEAELKIVYRDFPLSFHDEANAASLAVNAAGEQGKFWEMADLVFAGQDELSEEKFIEWAGQLGLDKKKFISDRESEAFRAEIEGDIADAESYRVSGTPTMFLEGLVIGGYLDAAELAGKIREKL